MFCRSGGVLFTCCFFCCGGGSCCCGCCCCCCCCCNRCRRCCYCCCCCRSCCFYRCCYCFHCLLLSVSMDTVMVVVSVLPGAVHAPGAESTQPVLNSSTTHCHSDVQGSVTTQHTVTVMFRVQRLYPACSQFFHNTLSQ